jgi:hypothetical protein
MVMPLVEDMMEEPEETIEEKFEALDRAREQNMGHEYDFMVGLVAVGNRVATLAQRMFNRLSTVCCHPLAFETLPYTSSQHAASHHMCR